MCDFLKMDLMDIFLESHVTFNLQSNHLNFGPTKKFYWAINNWIKTIDDPLDL